MLWNTDEGGGGLGVLVRDTGLVKPPSLVRSAVVTLLLLQVEPVDIPRRGLLMACSSTGELPLELACNALVRSDCCRSLRGFDLEKVVAIWSNGKGLGRWGSGGSSRSATISSSEAMAGGAVGIMFCMGAVLKGFWLLM